MVNVSVHLIWYKECKWNIFYWESLFLQEEKLWDTSGSLQPPLPWDSIEVLAYLHGVSVQTEAGQRTLFLALLSLQADMDLTERWDLILPRPVYVG